MKPSKGPNQRAHERLPLRCKFKIWSDSIGEAIVTTRDVSDGGLFLITDNIPALPVGTILQGQVQGMMADAPVVTMEVVRVEDSGIGLKFLSDTK